MFESVTELPENMTHEEYGVHFQDLNDTQFKAITEIPDSSDSAKALWIAGLCYHHRKKDDFPFARDSTKCFLYEDHCLAATYFKRAVKTSPTPENLLYKGYALLQLGLYRYQFANYYYSGHDKFKNDLIFKQVQIDSFSAYNTFKDIHNNPLAARAIYLCGMCHYDGGHGIEKSINNALTYFAKAADLVKDSNDNNVQHLYADIEFMKGKCYEGLQLHDFAKECFIKAAQFQCSDKIDQQYAQAFHVPENNAAPTLGASLLDSLWSLFIGKDASTAAKVISTPTNNLELAERPQSLM